MKTQNLSLISDETADYTRIKRQATVLARHRYVFISIQNLSIF